MGLLPGVATQGSYNRKVKHTTHLGDAVQIQNYSFSRNNAINNGSLQRAGNGADKASPGVERGAVQQGAVEMVADEVGADHRAFAVFGSGDGSGDNQVGFVPHVQ